jgi:DNA replication protein DnaD
MTTTKNEKPRYTISVRFGDDVLQAGHTTVPNLVLNHYAELGITAAEMMFTIHVWQYWWTEREPHPSLRTIAARMSVSRRQVGNYTSSLKRKGYLKVTERHSPSLGQVTSEYDFSPMFQAIVTRARATARSAEATPMKNPSRGGRKDPSRAPLNDSSTEEYEVTRKTKDKKDQDNSNVRMNETEQTTHTTHQTTSRSRTVGEILEQTPLSGLTTSSASPSTDQHGPERQAIASLVVDFARQLGDRAPLKSSTTRAYKLYEESGLDLKAFISCMYEARSVTQEYTASIKAAGEDPTYGGYRKMKIPYFFAVLEDKLGLKDTRETVRGDVAGDGEPLPVVKSLHERRPGKTRPTG